MDVEELDMRALFEDEARDEDDPDEGDDQEQVDLSLLLFPLS